MEQQFISALCAADPKLGLRRDIAKIWNVIEKDPMEATTTIVVVEGCVSIISPSPMVSGGPKGDTIGQPV